MTSEETRPAVTGKGVPLWGVQVGPAPTMPPATPRPATTPPAVVLGGHDSADDLDTDLAAPAPVTKPVLGARLAVDVLPGGDVPGAAGQAAVGAASPPAPDLRPRPGAAVGPVREVALPSQPAQAPQPLPVQDVLPGRDLLTAVPVKQQAGAGRPSALPAPTSASVPAGEAYDRPVVEVAAAVAPAAAVPAGLATVPPPGAPDGAGSGQSAPVHDLSTSLVLLLATGPGAPPSTVPPAAAAVVDVPQPAVGPALHEAASAWAPAPGDGPFAASPANGAAQDAAHLVPAQVRRRVELGFRDGSSTALDPDSEQALALAELSSLLTGRD